MTASGTRCIWLVEEVVWPSLWMEMMEARHKPTPPSPSAQRISCFSEVGGWSQFPMNKLHAQIQLSKSILMNFKDRQHFDDIGFSYQETQHSIVYLLLSFNPFLSCPACVLILQWCLQTFIKVHSSHLLFQSGISFAGLLQRFDVFQSRYCPLWPIAVLLHLISNSLACQGKYFIYSPDVDNILKQTEWPWTRQFSHHHSASCAPFHLERINKLTRAHHIIET